MKAVVLAAGTGQRFRPLTETRPKPMLPIGNKILLEHVIGALKTADVREIVIVVGYQSEHIQNHFGNGDECDIEYVTQERPLGTGDALLQAEHVIADDFLLVNGDRVVDTELLTRLQQAQQTVDGNHIAVTRVDDPTQYGMVEIDDNRITNLVEKPNKYAVTSQIVNLGVYALSPDIFAAIRQTNTHGELALTTVLSEHLDDQVLTPVHYDGLWFELTRPWDLLTANQDLLQTRGGTRDPSAVVHDDATVIEPSAIGPDARIDPGARILRNTTLGANVAVGANAVIENAVVLEGTSIGPGAVVRDAIVGANATLGPNVTIEGGHGDVIVDETLYTDVRFGGLVGDDATISGSATVSPGTILANETTVATGTSVSGTFPNSD
ncbi:sugar phosphate nucleotidyltransferase [Haloarcula laminariae]|uniref:sugar phosphate nucleotidyltransferase n=1 Tax=Haloarcula laminariae TaxID=2961577 RepID=UPI0024062B0D|nr:sugar phosphate nucleotidyltransferase [Halomicroarcula sp. FL173]